MDRKRVYEFLDEKTASAAAAAAPAALKGGILVDLSTDGSNAEGGGERTRAPEEVSPEHRARALQTAVESFRFAASSETKSHASGTSSSTSTAPGLTPSTNADADAVQVLVSLRPAWDPEETTRIGTANDRGQPEFECVTCHPSGLTVHLHAERLGVGGKTSVISRSTSSSVVKSSSTTSSSSSAGAQPQPQEQLATEDILQSDVAIDFRAGDAERPRSMMATCAEDAPAGKPSWMRHAFGPTEHDELVERILQQTVPIPSAGASRRSAVVILHGQTGSGKTYTARKLHRAALQFLHEEQSESSRSVEVVSVKYQECQCTGKLVDLMEVIDTTAAPGGNIRGGQKNSDTFSTLHEQLERAAGRRASRETTLHEASSRSHAICTITCREVVEQNKRQTETTTFKFTVVDLAGAERSLDTFANRGMAMRETQFISTSLATLHECVRAMAAASTKKHQKRGIKVENDEKVAFIPWRATKLTLLLRDLMLPPSKNHAEAAGRRSDSAAAAEDVEDGDGATDVGIGGEVVAVPQSTSSEAEKSSAVGIAPPTAEGRADLPPVIFWVAHLCPMSYHANYTKRTLAAANTVRDVRPINLVPQRPPQMVSRSGAGPRSNASIKPPEKWSKAEVERWVKSSLPELNYLFEEKHGFQFPDGRSLKHEWKYDLGKKIAACGGNEEDGLKVYDAFHDALRKYKKTTAPKTSSKAGEKC